MMGRGYDGISIDIIDIADEQEGIITGKQMA